MDARTLIDNYIDGEILLEHYGFKSININDSVYRSTCRFCDSLNDTVFAYNSEDNTFFCHRCKKHGDAYQLIMYLEECEYPDAIMKMAELFKVDIGNLKLTTLKSNSQKETEQWLKLVKSKLERSDDSFEMPNIKLKEIKKFRHFKKETIDYFEAKFTPLITLKSKSNEDYQLKNRIVLPIKKHNILKGILLRRTNNKDIMKWSNQGFSKKEYLYNYDNCIKYLIDNPDCNSVIVCEGAFDVWNYVEQGIYNVVSTFGCSISKEQSKLLLGMCTELILSYDGDEAGRIGTSEAIDKLKYKFDLYYITFQDKKDPGNTNNLNELLCEKKFYTNWKE